MSMQAQTFSAETGIGQFGGFSPDPFHKDAERKFMKAIEKFPDLLKSPQRMDERDISELNDLIIYHSNREDFMPFVFHEFEDETKQTSDMWTLRGKSAILILEEIFQQESSGVRNVRDAINFLSMTRTPFRSDFSGGKAIWTPMLENLDCAESGKFGEVVAIMTGSFLETSPDYKESRAHFEGFILDNEKGCSHKAAEQISFCIMPFKTFLMKKLIMESRATDRRRVKDLANRLSKVLNGSLSEVYEFIAIICGDTSWNHFSARLK